MLWYDESGSVGASTQSEESIGAAAALAAAIYVCSVIAAIAGTGGGSLFIAIFSMAYPADVHKAVPLSKVAVFGVALGASIVNCTLLSGRKESKLSPINFHLATLMQPATLVGCIFGVLLNLVLSNFAISIALCGILGFTAFKTFGAAVRLRDEVDAENYVGSNPLRQSTVPFRLLSSAAEVEMIDDVSTISGNSPPIDIRSENGATPTNRTIRASYFAQIDDEAEDEERVGDNIRKFEEETVFFNGRSSSYASRLTVMSLDVTQSFLTAVRKEVAYLICIWFLNLLCVSAAGGPAALVCGTPWQRALICLGICLDLGSVWYTGNRLKLLTRTSSNTLTLEKLWWVNRVPMVEITSLSFLAGACAGLLGIGGGLIKGPVLISVGLTPMNAVATSNYMILFTSTTNISSFFLAGERRFRRSAHACVFLSQGRLDLTKAYLHCLFSFGGGLTGVLLLRTYLSSKRRQVWLTNILGVTIVVGGLAVLSINLLGKFMGSSHLEETLAEACDHLRERTNLFMHGATTHENTNNKFLFLEWFKKALPIHK